MLTKTATKTNALIITALLTAALLVGACGDVQERYEAPPVQEQTEILQQRLPQGECRATVKAVAGITGLKGVLDRDKHDANPGTPNTIEFEVVTGMFEGICADEPELYVNGNPAKMLRSDGVTTSWLASVDASEPEVLLTAYCGQCKQGVWGATIQ